MTIAEGQTLTGAQFAEPMRVETVRENGAGGWDLGLIGTRSEQFRRVVLTNEDLASLAIADAALSYQGDGRRLRLALRVLVVCPANLAFQWQRELKEKFDERFLVLKGSDIRDQFGVNQWLEQKQVITSLDLAKREDILPGLKQARWDLVIVDEAHRMSADEKRKSQRYRLGEMLRDSTDHLLCGRLGTPRTTPR